ncbi:MAG: folylpolyglutamate synthase/dihydrofolate synthase family protein [bacterium]|jgi:dihydrofolate synthase/folylpolyglutamate synthase|nr:folylpolyglutamate synthase/dihydrofolate synthase family protein [bacterium]
MLAMNYEQAMSYLKNLQFAYKKYDTKKIAALLERRRRPQDSYRTVHVVGTNGKGSTTAFIAAGLQAAGFRVGMFTSPHLSDFRERFRVNGQKVTRKRLASTLEKIIPDMQSLDRNPFIGHPTYFETLVAMGLELFRELAVDFAVVEAGLGGRLDGTNIFSNTLPVLTNVGLEHTGILGRNLSAIALEKAAVVLPNSILFTGETRPRIIRLLEDECARRKATLFPVAKRYRISIREIAPGGMRFNVKGPGFQLANLVTPLLGRHQGKNALVALAVLRHLGITDPETLGRGFAAARWPGRLEIISGEPSFILDGAHNPDGIRTLVRALNDLPFIFGKRIHCVFAALKDKKHRDVVRLLAPHIHQVIVTRPNTSRAAEPSLLADVFRRHGCQNVTVEKEHGRAFKRARSEAANDDIVLITGSLYLVGNLRPLIVT